MSGMSADATVTDAVGASIEAARVANERAAYTAGLRALADALDADPDFQLPYSGTSGDLQWITGRESAEDQRALLVKVAKLCGHATKGVRDNYFDLDGKIHGLVVSVIADRDAVCRRVVNGTTTVTTTEPDPDYVAAAPMVERTEVVEDVEWVCEPLLADRADEPVRA